jgi:hypothetical protein
MSENDNKTLKNKGLFVFQGLVRLCCGFGKAVFPGGKALKNQGLREFLLLHMYTMPVY